MVLWSTLAVLLSPTLAAYTIVDDYMTGNFANQFDFFTGNDPTNGYVNYVDYTTAQASGLYSASSDRVYIGVDHNNTASGRGRNSVRISSKKSYQHGLIILDLAHMPGGACGTWPAFWLLSTTAEWPNGGEVDIIEGVNSQSYNTMAAHTDAGCSISSNNGSMSGQILTSNCDVKAPNQASNQGCSIKSTTPNTFGTGFNANGGGIYATEWTSNGFSIWFFPRNAIPRDITNGNPDTSGWGLPISRFAGNCDWDEKVVNQQIIFDVTFCGDWAGNVFGSDDTCKSKASSCQAYVQNNPAAFVDTYWSINSLKVYQQVGQTTTTRTSSSIATATSVSSTTSSSTSPSTTSLSTTSPSTTSSSTTSSSTTSSSTTSLMSTSITIQTLSTSFVTLTRTITPTSVTSISPSASQISSTISSQLSSSITYTTLSTSVILPTSTTSIVTSTYTTVSSASTPTSTSTTTSTSTYVFSVQTSTQSMPLSPTMTASTIYTSSAANSQWQGWPNTFYTVTRPGGWGGSSGEPGNWGGHGGWGRPTGR